MCSRDNRPNAAEKLAEATGKPESEFSAEGYEIPELDELEWVSADEE
jgi:hypothetical protein